MTISEWIGVASSIFMAIGLVFSLLLWRTTVHSLQEIRRQNDNIARSIKTDIIHKITTSHQNIFLAILSNSELASALTGEKQLPDGFLKEMLGTLLINHCAAVHLCGTQQTLEAGDWLGMQNDIADLFSWPIVKKRWPQIRPFYSREFQDFIDTVVVRGERVD